MHNLIIYLFIKPEENRGEELKVDAIPGRLNKMGFVINRSSTFLGQCSELCGALHYGMPIGIKAVSLSQFLSYVVSYSE